MDDFVVGGDDSDDKQAGHSYGHIDKPQTSAAESSPQETNTVSVELMTNSPVSPELLVQYCNKRFSAYSSARITILEDLAYVLSIRANKPVEFLQKGVKHTVQRYFLCGHCLAHEQRERKTLRRHVEACQQREIVPSALRLPSAHASALRDKAESTDADSQGDTTTVTRSRNGGEVALDGDGEAEMDAETEADSLVLTALTVKLRTDSKVSVTRVEQYTMRRFGSYFENSSLVGASLTICEDALHPFVLDLRTNFDFEFVRPLLGADTTRHIYVCGRCLGYETMKKTHSERHLDKGSCGRRRHSSQSNEDDTEQAPRCFFERSILPQVKAAVQKSASITPDNKVTTRASNRRVSSRHAQESRNGCATSSTSIGIHWQPTERVDVSDGASLNVIGGTLEPLAGGLQCVRPHGDDVVVLQVGATPIIVLGGGVGSRPIYIQSPHAPIVIHSASGGNAAASVSCALGLAASGSVASSLVSGSTCAQLLQPSSPACRSLGGSAKRFRPRTTSDAE